MWNHKGTQEERTSIREQVGRVGRNGAGWTSDQPRQRVGRKHGKEGRCSSKNLNLNRYRV